MWLLSDVLAWVITYDILGLGNDIVTPDEILCGKVIEQVEGAV